MPKKVKVNGKWFRDLIRDRNMTTMSVAKKLGMPQHTSLSLTFSGRRRMQLSEAVALSHILSVPLADIVQNAGFHLGGSPRGVAVIGILHGDGTVESVPDNTTRAVLPDGLPPSAVAVQARTADSPLSWMDRWVFFCEDRTAPDDNVIGRFCLASYSKGKLRIGVLRRGYEAGSFSLTGPDFKGDLAKIDWVRPIIFTRN